MAKNALVRDCTTNIDSIKGYATKEMAAKKRDEVFAELTEMSVNTMLVRNTAGRWVIVLAHNPNAHHISMYAIHKNNNIMVFGN
jgi:hypothetical protein